MAGTMDRQAVAQVMEQIAAFMELRGDNPFRVRAYRSAAKAIAALPTDLPTALADGTLATTKGVGPATQQLVAELVATGRCSLLEELREMVPPGLVEMLQISGLGVARIRQIHETLGIETLPELEAAARDGRLAALPRFGQKTADNIVRGIAFLRQASAFRLAHHAREEAEALRAALERLPGVLQAHVAGDVRRRAEVVRDLAIVLVAEGPATEIFGRLGQVPGISEIAGQDERRATLRFAGGGAAQVVVTTPANLGAVLVQSTGAEGHLAELATRARERGLALDGAALWRGSIFLPTPDEAAFYAALDLPVIPPELREGLGEVVAAAGGLLPVLVEQRELKGFLHCHSTYSDGSNTVAELAAACRDAGYAYLGITDHSRSAAYAGGLQLDDIARQHEEIAVAQEQVPGIRILKGIEADILADGSLDYDDATLARFDFVIGSVHSRFTMDEAEMTGRLLRAMDNPFLTIIGHPTGRLLLSRDPYPVNLDALFAKAADTGVALEINADPHRLDLDWRHVRRAVAQGAVVSIGADAHNLAGMANVEFGVAVARKAGVPAARILNTRSADEFVAWARRRR